MILKYIYTVFLGVLLATFVGVGIAAFYPEPKYPEFPPHAVPYPRVVEGDRDSTLSGKIRKDDVESYRISKEFQELSQTHSRNVSTISLAFAIVILLVSLTVVKNLISIADGVLLGGVLTLLYSIVRGFGSEDNMFRFIVISIGLVITLILGYLKFIKPNKNQS